MPAVGPTRARTCVGAPPTGRAPLRFLSGPLGRAPLRFVAGPLGRAPLRFVAGPLGRAPLRFVAGPLGRAPLRFVAGPLGRAPLRFVSLAALLLALTVSGCAGPAPTAAPAPSAPSAPTSPTPSAPGPGTGAPAPDCVDTTLGRLDTAGRAAQLVMAGAPADGLDAASRGALERGVGGIILTDPAGGGEANATAVASTTRAAQGAARDRDGIPLLVSTDQEGGKVQDLAGSGFTEIPAAEVQGRDPAGLRADARGWARELSRAGVNVDLAPVADVVDPDLGRENAPVGQYGRGFGTDRDAVSPAVGAFVRGMGDGGVAATLKHFPGLGKVRRNTDFAGGVEDTVTGRGDPDLASFRAGIDAGAPLVMMSSARYARIDPDRLALFSRTVISDVLRGDLGFDGVVMTDDVGVAEALADVPVGERATRFVAAGGDLVLTVRGADAGPMVTALAKRAERDPAFRARIDESARRVLALKEKRAGLRCR